MADNKGGGNEPPKINHPSLVGKGDKLKDFRDADGKDQFGKAVREQEQRIGKDKPFVEKIGDTKKPFVEREGIKENSPKAPSEPPKSRGWQGRSGRGGGFVPDPFQRMIDRKQMIPRKPLSQLENEKIEPETNSPNYSGDKEKILITMGDFQEKKYELPQKGETERNKVLEPVEVKENELSIQNEPLFLDENKEKLVLAMNNFKEEKPSFLKEIEGLEPKPLEIDLGDPSMEGDASDGGDGGAVRYKAKALQDLSCGAFLLGGVDFTIL
ncbi:MAG: hypothetical protein GYB31_01800 [Bacteroidetes bacterium]|nr:hypothetical protein [Bacteroidota bacterium]